MKLPVNYNYLNRMSEKELGNAYDNTNNENYKKLLYNFYFYKLHRKVVITFHSLYLFILALTMFYIIFYIFETVENLDIASFVVGLLISMIAFGGACGALGYITCNMPALDECKKYKAYVKNDIKEQPDIVYLK